MRTLFLGILLLIVPAAGLAAEPAACGTEFRVVQWNTATGGHPNPACNSNWNAGMDQDVADSIVHYATLTGANVITLQEMSALALTNLQAALPGWDCRYQEFSYDDHVAICVDGTASGFYAQRLDNVTNELPDPPCDPQNPSPCDPPVCDPELSYWWGYVQVEYEGVLITSVHTRSFWDDEHVDQLHEEVRSGIIAGDFNHTNPVRPPAGAMPPARPWHQTDLAEEWTWEGWRGGPPPNSGLDCWLDDQNRCVPHPDAGCTWTPRKIDHVLVVEEPAQVWGDAVPDDDPLCPVRDASTMLCSPTAPSARRCKEGSNHRVVLSTVTFPESPAIEAVITNAQQPLEVGPGCQATVEFEITLHDHCCLDPNDLGLQVTATNPTANAMLGPVSIDSVVALGPRDVEVTGHVEVSALQSCPAEIAIEATAQDCSGDVADTVSQGTGASVLAIDTTPPVVAAGDDVLHCLWPPDHKYVCFDAADFSPIVTDNCAANPAWEFDSCASSQPDNGIGDGHTTDDCVLAAGGLCARAERAGGLSAGRDYDLAIRATDTCGNVAGPTPIGNIHVPHDRSDAQMCLAPQGRDGRGARLKTRRSRIVPSDRLSRGAVRSPSP